MIPDGRIHNAVVQEFNFTSWALSMLDIYKRRERQGLRVPASTKALIMARSRWGVRYSTYCETCDEHPAGIEGVWWVDREIAEATANHHNKIHSRGLDDMRDPDPGPAVFEPMQQEFPDSLGIHHPMTRENMA